MKKFFYIFIAFSFLIACNDELVENPNIILEDEILSFSSNLEMYQELSSVYEMSIEEKYQWEKSKNFISLGLSSERFIDELRPEEYTSIDEIKNTVYENNQYIKLIEDADGELELVPRYYNIPFRYLANLNGVFKVGDRVFRVYDEGLISVPFDNYETLLQLTYSNAIQIENCRIHDSLLDSKKSVNSGCIDGTTVYAEKDRERIKFTLTPGYRDLGSIYQVSCYLELRPYKKVLIWFPVARSVSYDHYMSVYIDQGASSKFYESWGSGSGYGSNYTDWVDVPNAYFLYESDVFIYSFYSWGKQENTGKAYAICYTN